MNVNTADIINISNLAAYTSLFPCCHSVIKLFNYSNSREPGGPAGCIKKKKKKEEKKISKFVIQFTKGNATHSLHDRWELYIMIFLLCEG